jgi:hypothetical protein
MAPYLVVLAVVLPGIAALAFVMRRYAQLRGTRVVSCPETNDAVAVEIDAGRAALTGAYGKARFNLTGCTRWPENASNRSRRRPSTASSGRSWLRGTRANRA